MKKEQLIKYCKNHDIWFPSNPTKEYLEAAVYRAAMHQKEEDKRECFGYWENENQSCVVCNYGKECFKLTMGIEKEEYFKQFNKVENPKVRISKTLAKKKKKK